MKRRDGGPVEHPSEGDLREVAEQLAALSARQERAMGDALAHAMETASLPESPVMTAIAQAGEQVARLKDSLKAQEYTNKIDSIIPSIEALRANLAEPTVLPSIKLRNYELEALYDVRRELASMGRDMSILAAAAADQTAATKETLAVTKETLEVAKTAAADSKRAADRGLYLNVILTLLTAVLVIPILAAILTLLGFKL